MDKENKRLNQFESRLRNLESEPSPETWDRLQEMLRQRRRQQPFRIFRLTSIAAGFLLLAALGLTYLFVLSDRPGLLASKQDRPFVVEELETNGDQHLKEMAEKTRALFVSDQSFVKEGKRQKLVPASNTASPVSNKSHASSLHWSINDLSFLQGKWIGQDNGLTISDSWAKLRENTLKNTRKINRNGEELVEVWELQQKEDRLVLTIRNKQANKGMLSLEAPVDATDSNTLIFSDENGEHIIKIFPDLPGYEMNFFSDKPGRTIVGNAPFLFRRDD